MPPQLIFQQMHQGEGDGAGAHGAVDKGGDDPGTSLVCRNPYRGSLIQRTESDGEHDDELQAVLASMQTQMKLYSCPRTDENLETPMKTAMKSVTPPPQKSNP